MRGIVLYPYREMTTAICGDDASVKADFPIRINEGIFEVGVGRMPTKNLRFRHPRAAGRISVMSLKMLKKAYEHLWWADELAGESLKTLELVEEPDSREYHALELFAHIVGAELIWLDRIEGVPQSVPVWPEMELSRCLDLQRSAKLRYADFLDGLADEDLSRAVRYTNSAGSAFTSYVEDILMHVALHGAYHRGQVALLVREGGGTPNPTDFIALTRGAPAATRVRPA